MSVSFEQELASLDGSLEEFHALPEKLTRDQEAQLLELLIQRNQILSSDLTRQVAEEPQEAKNHCYFLTNQVNIPLEFRSYHAGPFGQTTLREKTLTEYGADFEDQMLYGNRVFFTLCIDEVLDYLGLDHHTEEFMAVYVTDLREAKDARVQTDYSTAVQFADRLRTLVEIYENPLKIDEMDKDGSAMLEYAEPFRTASKTEIRSAIMDEINGWVSKFTKAFEIASLQAYNDQRFYWILAGAPISVRYES